MAPCINAISSCVACEINCITASMLTCTFPPSTVIACFSGLLELALVPSMPHYGMVPDRWEVLANLELVRVRALVPLAMPHQGRDLDRSDVVANRDEMQNLDVPYCFHLAAVLAEHMCHRQRGVDRAVDPKYPRLAYCCWQICEGLRR